MKALSCLTKYSLAAVSLVVASQVSADTIFGIYAGAGSWQSEYSGDVGQTSASLNDLGVDDNNNSFYYIAVEHPIPLIPNIKLQQNDISSSQTGTLSNDFNLSNQPFPAGTAVTTDFDLSYTDAVLYYEILDNWLNLDVGITVRKYSGELIAQSLNASDSVDVDVTLPLGYARFQFDLPLTGFSAGVEANLIRYEDNSISDYSAKISYMFDSALDLGVEVGYKTASIQIDEDDVNTDIRLKGPYAAAIFHF
uniref:TIGR04219 family outer membrane beta-barrel protein n=1 Tax=Cellvibrio fontiphilus TaxID=1815559 RepID=UPI002B4BD669|nr:TIGR04219 family outer membrane beta-barrel protein [Cellvibrio fontiphilus]